MIAAPPFWDLIPAQLGASPPAGDWNSLTSGSVTAMRVASLSPGNGVKAIQRGSA
jgi:hypothetical protein